MVRIYGSGIVGGMAGVTIARRSCKTCSVALGTGGSSMNTGQREVRGCVVKACIQPIIQVVAHRAVYRVLLGFVILRSVILNLMTSDAIRWGIEDCSFMAR